MNAADELARVSLTPLALKDTPALIEAVFPAQKISFEAQRERKAGAGQTLTSLGSYWKGRKPLILVRAIVLGSLLPQTGDAEQDLDIFERLMALDEESLVRRALANDGLRPRDIAARIILENPWKYFKTKIKAPGLNSSEIVPWTFPLDCEKQGISLSWQRDVTQDDKLMLYRKALTTFRTYEEKAALCKRPEEVDPDWLYEPAWRALHRYYA